MSTAVDKRIAKLDKKISQARAKGQYIQAIQYEQEKKLLRDSVTEETQRTLKDVMDGWTRESRMEMTSQIIIAVAIADMLVSATMDVESKFRRAGIGVFRLWRS